MQLEHSPTTKAGGVLDGVVTTGTFKVWWINWGADLLSVTIFDFCLRDFLSIKHMQDVTLSPQVTTWSQYLMHFALYVNLYDCTTTHLPLVGEAHREYWRCLVHTPDIYGQVYLNNWNNTLLYHNFLHIHTYKFVLLKRTSFITFCAVLIPLNA